MIALRLDSGEMMCAAQVGTLRRVRALARNRGEPYGTPRCPWDADIEGAAAELLVARELGRYWHPALDPDRKVGDVAGVDVRHTRLDGGALILHDEDIDDRPYVLVTGSLPLLTIRGHLHAETGKDRRWWRTDTGRPAYFVPQAALDPGLPEAYKATDFARRGQQHVQLQTEG